MFKVQISILDNKSNINFLWEISANETPTAKNLSDEMMRQIQKAQIAAANVANGAKIGRIRPTNIVQFKVHKFNEYWEEVQISERLSQLGNMRLMGKGADGWNFNDFKPSIDFVLDTLDF